MEKLNSELVRASITDIANREQEADLFKSRLKTILATPMTLDMKKQYRERGVSITNGDLIDAINASLVLQALSGNIAAYTTIRDTMGYKPVEQVKNDVSIKIEMPKEVRELGE